jgi:indolepyruvate ferredoxin oxidoreductase beta subunit
MKQDIILAGVGGQGILSIAYVIDNAALKAGLNFKQAEVHGMARRGGAVQSHLRLSREVIYSELIPRGQVDLLLSVEPLEALRYLDSLHAEARIVSCLTPMRNIPDYPDVEQVLAALRDTGRAVVIDSQALAREAGSTRAQNMVILGAAASHLVLEESDLLDSVEELFAPKGDDVVEVNLKAYRLGKEAAAGAI